MTRPAVVGDVLASDALGVAFVALLAAVTIVVLAGLAVQPAKRRLYVALGAVPALALALAHALITFGIAPADLADATRLAGYGVALPLVVVLVGRVAGLRRWLIGTFGAVALGHVLALVGWLLLEGQAGLVSLVVAVLLAGAVAYGVLDATSTPAPRSRRLLVGRLAGVLAVVWPLVVLTLGLSPAGTAVVDAEIATFLGGYLDVAFGGAVGVLLARSGSALDAMTDDPAPGDAVAAPGVDDERRGVEPGLDEETGSVSDGGQSPDDGDHSDASAGRSDATADR